MANFPVIYRKWAQWAVFNLMLVAVAGVIIRSKIIFPLAFISQKNLLHGHSHFAFTGWVSLALFTGITALLYPDGPDRWMRRLFMLLLISAYGMLLTFPFMGYRWPSIFFSTLSIVFSYLLAAYTWKRFDLLPRTVRIWFRAAMVFNVISSFGTYALAWIMSQRGISQEFSIGSLYFFLHFQYNGWFFFCCAGFFFHLVHVMQVPWPERTTILLFRLFTISAVPAFFLSALWMRLPAWMYWLALLAALVQVPAIVIFIWQLSNTLLLPNLHRLTRMCFSLSLAALTIKFLLQLLSCIPSLSIYAFGYRPLVIAFLHLVLLGFVSLFMLGYFMQQRWLKEGAVHRRGLYIFVAGVILNETVLILQGLGAIGYVYFPHTNELLWLIALTMLTGIIWLNRKSA